MPINFDFGTAGGQQYDIKRAIRGKLQHLSEGSLETSNVVIRELLQNADDANATQLVLILDERTAPSSLPPGYGPMLGPSLIAWNNAPFRTPSEVEDGEKDDFASIRDVAGHNKPSPAAAGRFGIGFNSVYFFTDTPILFSRKEVHVFDLLGRIVVPNGRGFTFADLRSQKPAAEELKTVIDWSLPVVALSGRTFRELISEDVDYTKSVFRLPLRLTGGNHESLYEESFPLEEDRIERLHLMWEEAARSVLFLKTITDVVFNLLDENGLRELGRVNITANPPEFVSFVESIKKQGNDDAMKVALYCDLYARTTTNQWTGVRDSNSKRRSQSTARTWSFTLAHSAPFADKELSDLRTRLRDNGERAVPWVSVAIPTTIESFGIDVPKATWRVFLPVAEEAPCKAIFHSAFFVGESRKQVEFSERGTDEAKRKTDWNKGLVKRALIPLFQQVNDRLVKVIPDIIKSHPQEYLSLFPSGPAGKLPSKSLNDFLRDSFYEQEWRITVEDFWGQSFELVIGGPSVKLTIEIVPDWLGTYSELFRHLTSSTRRFVSRTIGSALSDLLKSSQFVGVSTSVGNDAIRAILQSDTRPNPKDLAKLLKLLNSLDRTADGLQGLWCFQKSETSELIRFDRGTLYLLAQAGPRSKIHEAFRELGLNFEGVERIEPEVGIVALPDGSKLENIVSPDKRTALELLRRTVGGDQHDRLKSPEQIRPIVDFLCSQPAHQLPNDMRLGFLIKTGRGQKELRSAGVILLEPIKASADQKVLLELLLNKVFPTVDRGFAAHISRLLSHAPGLQPCLSSEFCAVERLEIGQMLQIFHRARLNSIGFCDTLREYLNGSSARTKQNAQELTRATSLVLEEINQQWDRLPYIWQLTALLLPIHRTADGKFASLLQQRGPDRYHDFYGFEFRKRFRVLPDDLEDALVSSPGVTLLHCDDRDAFRFYRHKLGIEEFNRAFILKDCFERIGSAGNNNSDLLEYIGKNFALTLNQLDRSGASDAREAARELRRLVASSKTVSCTDGVWRSIGDALNGQEAVKELSSQGWDGDQLRRVLEMLAWPKGIACSTSNAAWQLWHSKGMQRLDVYSLPLRAISSEHLAFSLGERAKVIIDNHEKIPLKPASHGMAIDSILFPTLSPSGRHPLNGLRWVDYSNIQFSPTLIRVLFPAAVDLEKLADEIVQPVNKVPLLLTALGLSPVQAKQVSERIVSVFCETWPKLDALERIEWLAYIGSAGLQDRLTAKVEKLPVILNSLSQWVPPAAVIAPRWLDLDPPGLEPSEKCFVDNIPNSVLKVWNVWCRVRDLKDIVRKVIAGMPNAAKNDTNGSATQLYLWLDSIATLPIVPERDLREALNNSPWVLARKGQTSSFQNAAETVPPDRSSLLSSAFWVRETRLPDFVAKSPERYQLKDALPATVKTLTQLVDCLREVGTANPEDAIRIYELIASLIADHEELELAWKVRSRTENIFRLFRDPEITVSAQRLILGNDDVSMDFGEELFCLGAIEEAPPNVFHLYKRLGIKESPTYQQIVSALSRRPGSPEYEKVYASLTDALVNLPTSKRYLKEVLKEIHVLCCSGEYRPLKECHRSETLLDPKSVAPQIRHLIIDESDEPTGRLVRWLLPNAGELVLSLETIARAEISSSQQRVKISKNATRLISLWAEWFEQLASEDSTLRELAIAQLNIEPPTTSFKIVPVKRIQLRYIMRDGSRLESPQDWPGVVAFHDSVDSILVRADETEKNFVKNPEDLQNLDREIAIQVCRLLQARNHIVTPERVIAFVQNTLERPGVILDTIRKEKSDSIFALYYDNVADSEFAQLFEQYRRTGKKAAEKRQEIRSRMREIVGRESVRNRREQIRSYGYDEFSVFAELTQNAEDAYSQLKQLRMEVPATCHISYRYSSEDGLRVLEVEHRGRPFNCWQHGSFEERRFSFDVEGVLRSAGSFKAYFGGRGDPQSEAPTIGRFGLGFKSVYLLTDRPEIHSGPWHFAIEHGYLPGELSPPEDLDEDVTRIRLPLRADVEDLQDVSHLRDLLPFLRMITQIRFRTVTGTTCDLQARSEISIETDHSIVERVTLLGPNAGRDGIVRFLRCRTLGHAGQLALLLANDGSPARWDDAFQHDLFVALPLKTNLGCGVAASHDFEVQSGRTHLVDPKGNAKMVTEVANLLSSLVDGLLACASPDTPPTELLRRFWAVWRWEQGDVECEGLRKALATVLVRLAAQKSIVPTLDPVSPTKLGGDPCFYFFELPNAFREAIVAAEVPIRVEGHSATKLARTNVVAEGFAAAYRRARDYAGSRESRTLVGVGWEKVAEAFQEKAWFAVKPELLCSLAASINEEQFQKTAAWVALCSVLGEDGRGQALHLLPTNLLPPDFPEMQHLPRRLLRCVSVVYDEAALDLLTLAGLPHQPTSEEIEDWVHAATLTADECIGILRYLAADARFMEYPELANMFHSPWFPHNRTRLSTSEAAKLRLIPEDLFSDAVFKAWLGLVEKQPEFSEPFRPRLNPRAVLKSLFDWWQAHGLTWTRQYEKSLYPNLQPPLLRDTFYPNDLGERRQWVTLFLLAAFHTMGHTRFEQHRDFLLLCEKRGWLDVFADREHDAHRWIHVLEDYLEDPTGKHDYYHWMRQFIAIFQISRSLSDYVDSFLNVNRFKQPFALDSIIASRTSAAFSSGPDAPALTRTLGMGACFVMRELMRLRVLRQPLAHRYCYVPARRVCKVLEVVGCSALAPLPIADRSSAIHQFLVEHIGAEPATFDGGFDLPLLALARDRDMQVELLGRVLVLDDAGTWARPDEGWRTLPDGRRINLNW